ncbi:thioredoxin-disulfide reductase [Candidatus Woesearchaeota archaeon]|nr:thioredoxin-disulfide reductase [Candidatus Woesearchaeota archaeon]
MEKLVIIGSGCAGWTAAIYAARAGLKPTLITGQDIGGQIAWTTLVENYPGFPDGIMGPDLSENMKKQAKKFGTKILIDIVSDFKIGKNSFEIKMGKKKITAKCVIISTGASPRMLGLPSEKKYLGKGVSTCATCDAYFFKNKDVCIIGGGDSACTEALELTKFAKKVYLIHRRDELKASRIMQERVKKNKKIKIVWNTEVKEILGTAKGVNAVKLYNNKTKKTTKMKINGVFLAIGHIPNTKLFEGKVRMDRGYIVTDKFMKTNVNGLYAAGDVQDFVWRQAVTAAGSGCIAAIEAIKYLGDNK